MSSLLLARRGTLSQGAAAPGTGPVVWFKADAITGKVNADPISQWDDSSGNGRHAAQATGSAQPTYRTAVINGLPVVRFDGSDRLDIAAFGQSQQWTAFAVAKTATATSQQGVASTDPTGASRHAQLLRFNSAQLESLAFNTANAAATDVQTGSGTAFHVIEAVRDATSILALIDGTGTAPTATTGTPQSGSFAMVLGKATTIATGTDWLNGDIAEVIYYGVALDSAARSSIRATLGTKYAITVV